MGERRLFILSAILTKYDRGTITTNHILSYRAASDSEDAVVGSYVQSIMEQNPGFSLSGKVSVMEIPREDIEQALMKEADHG